jgi:hypothetical protein
MATRTFTLSKSLPAATASGVIVTPKKFTLSAVFATATASGAFVTPKKFILSGSLPEATSSGSFAMPGKFVLTASLPEASADGLFNKYVPPKTFGLSVVLPTATAVGFIKLPIRKQISAIYENLSVSEATLLSGYENQILSEIFVTNKALWFAKARISKTLAVGYASAPQVTQSREIGAGFATLIEKSLKLAYEQTTTTLKRLGLHYALTYPVSSSLRGVYDLLNVNRLSKTTGVPVTFEGDINAYLATPANAVMVMGLGSIDPIRMEVSTSGSENVWQISAQVPYDQATLVILGEPLTAQFNGLSFSAVFAGKSRTLSANSDTINVDAFSPSRALAYTPVESITQTNALVLLKALGVSRSTGLSDTGIKNLTAGQSALNLINAIANDMGAMLLCDADGSLTVAPSWQSSGNEWTVNEDMILDYNEVFVDGVAYNRITVSDSASFNSLRTEVVKTEDVANEWMVYVYGGTNVTASHTQEQATLVALGVQLIDKSEQVEVINGVANLAYTPTELRQVDWLHNAINAPMTLDGSRLLCGTDGDFGLLKVSYTVSASVFKLTYEKDEPIQLVIKGD